MRLRLVTAILLLAAASPAFAQSPWAPFHDPANGFSIEFPGTPKQSSAPQYGKFPAIAYEAQLIGANSVYTVLTVALTGHVHAAGGDFLATMIANYARGAGGVVRSERATTVAGLPALEGIVDDAAHNRTHVIDVLVYGPRSFAIISTGPRGSEAAPDGARFRRSFRFG